MSVEPCLFTVMVANMEEVLNTKKTKMMRCRKGGKKWKKIKWMWKGMVIGEVRESSI